MKEMIKKQLRRLQRVVHPVDNIIDLSERVHIEREYISYMGLERTGRSREALLSTLEKGCRALDDLGIVYWLGRGTLLGWYRDGNFLPGEIDLDVDVYTDQSLFAIVKHMPFEVMYVCSHQKSGKFTQLVFLDPDNDVIFDLCFYENEGGEIVNRLAPGDFFLPASVPDNLKAIDIDSRSYPVPDPEWYCRYWYGDGWKTPKKYRDEWVSNYKTDCSGFKEMPDNELRLMKYYE